MPRQKEQITLQREDLLWAGLTFERLSVPEFARQQGAVEDKVHNHQGVWWRQAKPLFCLPCFPYTPVDHRDSWPHPLRALVGFMHLSAPNSPSNGAYRAIVHQNPAQYSLHKLPIRRRYAVRKSLERLTVRPVEHLSDLLEGGYEVYVSFHRRTRWGRNKCDRRVFENWISKAFGCPKRLVLGAYQGNKLVAFILPSVVENTAMLGFIASHSDYLKCFPNDALFHALLSLARQTPGVEAVCFGSASSKQSLDSFKLQYGAIKTFPSFTWLNPAFRPIYRRWFQHRYPWLSPGISAVPGFRA